MKKICAICTGVLVSLFLLVSLPVFGADGVDIGNGMPAIINVYGNPVGIESNTNPYGHNECLINYGVLPRNMVSIAPGETLRIKVIGDKDILVRCNGEKGITINRE